MACIYCTIHQRGLIPEGWDTRKRHSVPAHWHPVPLVQLALATAVATVWHCTAQLAILERPCDMCAKEIAT